MCTGIDGRSGDHLGRKARIVFAQLRFIGSLPYQLSNLMHEDARPRNVAAPTWIALSSTISRTASR